MSASPAAFCRAAILTSSRRRTGRPDATSSTTAANAPAPLAADRRTVASEDGVVEAKEDGCGRSVPLPERPSSSTSGSIPQLQRPAVPPRSFPSPGSDAAAAARQQKPATPRGSSSSAAPTVGLSRPSSAPLLRRTPTQRRLPTPVRNNMLGGRAPSAAELRRCLLSTTLSSTRLVSDSRSSLSVRSHREVYDEQEQAWCDDALLEVCHMWGKSKHRAAFDAALASAKVAERAAAGLQARQRRSSKITTADGTSATTSPERRGSSVAAAETSGGLEQGLSIGMPQQGWQYKAVTTSYPMEELRQAQLVEAGSICEALKQARLAGEAAAATTGRSLRRSRRRGRDEALANALVMPIHEIHFDASGRLAAPPGTTAEPYRPRSKSKRKKKARGKSTGKARASSAGQKSGKKKSPLRAKKTR